MNTRKSFLFIFNQSPHSTLELKEGMDFAFSCAAFEQKVDALFRDEAVYHLLKKQNTSALKLKNHNQAIEAFELYGIEHCYYDSDSLKQRQLAVDDLIDIAESCNEQLKTLIQNYDYVLNY